MIPEDKQGLRDKIQVALDSSLAIRDTYMDIDSDIELQILKNQELLLYIEALKIGFISET